MIKNNLELFWTVLMTSFLMYYGDAYADDFPKLDEAVPGDFVLTLAPVFDFDGDGCLPSAGISRDGVQNRGLPVEGITPTDGCRSPDFLDTSNTLHRYTCSSRNGSSYCGHFYSLYFEKDDCLTIFCGHRHDWEYAAIWTTDGKITHGSYSAHGPLHTKALDELPLDENGHMKIVYHLTSSTHAFRFAGANEIAENPYDVFVTPTVTSWDYLTGDGISNKEMRTKLNSFDYGHATIPLKDDNFITNLNLYKPANYPAFFPQSHEDCEVTDLFSEEQGSQLCADGYAVTGIMCSGDYCDNKQLLCCRIPGLALEGPEIFSPFFSEEGTNSYANDNLAVVGMQCTGRYCDNISLIMRTAVAGMGGQWTEPFSDYGQGNCGSGYVAGVACYGRYCDDLSLYCRDVARESDDFPWELFMPAILHGKQEK